MAAGITDIRRALAEALGVIPGVQASAYLKANPTLPFVQVLPSQASYHRAMRDGVSELNFTVQAYSSLGLDRGAQELLDAMLEPSGTGSVKAAVEADPTLGGLVASCYVSGWQNYQLVQLAENVQALRVDFQVTVYT